MDCENIFGDRQTHTYVHTHTHTFTHTHTRTHTHQCKSEFVRSLAQLFARLWNQRAFKRQVSPQEHLQVCVRGPYVCVCDTKHCVCMYVCMYVRLVLKSHTNIHSHTRTHITHAHRTHTHTSHTHTRIHTHTHTHTHIHTHTQMVSSVSNKIFKIGQESDPLQYLSWLLHTLHKALAVNNDSTS